MSREYLDRDLIVELQDRRLEQIVPRGGRLYVGDKLVKIRHCSPRIYYLISFPFSSEEVSPADVFSKVVEGCVNGDETNSVHKANGFIVYRSRRSFNYAAQRGTWEPEGVSYHTEIQFFDYKLIEEES